MFRYWDEKMNTYRQDGRFTSNGNNDFDIVEILPLEEDAPKQTAPELVLIADNKALQARVQELEKTSKEQIRAATSLAEQSNQACERLIVERDDLRVELAKRDERLAQLEWRPVSVQPTKEDACDSNLLVVTDGSNITMWMLETWHLLPKHLTHWRAAALPVVKDEERERFNAWYEARCADPSQHKTQLREAMYDAWQAARKEGEV